MTRPTDQPPPAPSTGPANDIDARSERVHAAMFPVLTALLASVEPRDHVAALVGALAVVAPEHHSLEAVQTALAQAWAEATSGGRHG